MRTKNIIKTTFQILFCFIFLSKVSAQNPIKLLSEDLSRGVDVIDNTNLRLNYDNELGHFAGDTVIVKITLKDGKTFTSNFLPVNGDFTNVSIENNRGLRVFIFANNYFENGKFEVKIVSGYTDYYSICTSQIFIVSKSKVKTYSSDIYKVNDCGVTSNEKPREKSLKLWREDDQSFQVYGMNEESHIQFYNVLGKIIGHRIISRGGDFYKIELAEPMFPVFVNFNGSRQKL